MFIDTEQAESIEINSVKRIKEITQDLTFFEQKSKYRLVKATKTMVTNKVETNNNAKIG